MQFAARIAVTVVALLHLGFLVLEMFLWNTPTGHRIFAMTPEVAAGSQVLAMNQGLYNGFLAAGLAWGLFAKRGDLQLFFLGCVVIAGLFGGYTAKPTIYLVQALPGAIAFAFVLLASRARP